MVEKRVADAVAAHERWAYGEGWNAGLDEGSVRASTRASTLGSTPAQTSSWPGCGRP